MAGVLTLAMISATIVEKFCGSEIAAVMIYGSPWMIALWCVASVSSVCYIVSRRKSIPRATLLLHMSLGVILVGALVSHIWGLSGTLTLTDENRTVSSFTADGGLECPLPFDVTLDGCRVEYYPGTATPSDFVSEITVDGKAMTVAMNHVASCRGYRFFQTGMGDGATTLSVQYDPWGIAISYAGYAMLLVAMGAFFFSRRSWWARGFATALLLFASFSASAQPRAPQRAVASRFGTLMVNYNGRIAPVSTLAREFCLKIYGSGSYKGLTSEQVVTGWLFYYDDWKREPMIKVKGEDVRRRLGIKGEYASLQDFYDYKGYKLQDASPAADVMAVNEKTALISNVCTGAAFKIYPYRGADGRVRDWISWVDNRPRDMSLDDWKFVLGSMEYVARELAHKRDVEAWEALGSIRERQREMAGETAPSTTKIRAEIYYDRYARTLPVAVAALLVGFIGVFWMPARLLWLFRAVSVAVMIYLSVVMAVRGWLGGHLPLSNGYETMQAMAWCAAAFASIVSGDRARTLMPLALVVAGLALMVSMMGEHNPAITPLMPVLASPLLSVHVAVIMISYALFAIIAINSAVALCGRDSKERTRLSLRLLYPAAFLLAAGIFIGAVWANQSWGRYWGWDPKETWALITLLVYVLPMHAVSWPAFRRERVVNVYFVAAFASVLITYFGVNFILGGLHSYANG